MTTLMHADSRRLYSWWWDSHVSPKNSKWLQENLTDMDVKVKSMIKLIEEDADSFARRAEMYYKKRPELMKLVEEFYRAYRSLAERYDHATGALRQAQRTMAEVFPNQVVPFSLTDDSPSGSSTTDGEPRTPEMPPPIRAFVEPDDLQKDALGQSSHFHAIKRNGACSEDKDALNSKKGLKQVNEMFASGEVASQPKFTEGKVRKGLNFHEDEGELPECKTHNGSTDIQKNEKRDKHDVYVKMSHMEDEVSQLSSENQNLKMQVKSEHDRVAKSVNEILRLQESLSKSNADKDVALLQCHQSLEKMSNLVTKNSHTHEDNRELIKLARLESAEGRCLLLEREKQALEIKVKDLTQKTNQQQWEFQQKQDEVDKLTHSLQEEHVRYTQVEAALQSLEKLHSQSLEKLSITALELQSGVEKLQDMELRNRSLEEVIQQVKEANNYLHKELMLKEEELKKVNVSIQDERLLLVQAEEAIQSMRNLHSQSQEEIRILTLDAQSKVGMLKEMELKKQYLEEEVQQLLEKNGNLNEQVLSSVLMINNLQEEVLNLKETKAKLENEVEHHLIENKALQQEMQKLHSQSQEEIWILTLDAQSKVGMLKEMELEKQHLEEEVQQLLEKNGNLNEQVLSSVLMISDLQEEVLNLKEAQVKLENEAGHHLIENKALQQEIDCLREENADLGLKHHCVMEQIEAVGLNKESFQVSVRELQDENLELKELRKKHEDENAVLINKLEDLEKVIEKNTFLEISLSDVTAELEGLREKVNSLEEFCESLNTRISDLISENSSLVDQLESVTQNVEKLSETNTFLENSLSDANVELEGFRGKLKSLEESSESLYNENSILQSEKMTLASQVKNVDTTLENMYKSYVELEDKHINLEREKEETLDLVSELQNLLKLAQQEREAFVLSSNTQLATLQDQINLLQEESWSKDRRLEGLHHKLFNWEIQALILQRCLLDSKEWSQKHLVSSRHTEKLLSDQINLSQQEHDAFVLSSITQLATLGDQMSLLHEVSQSKDEKLEGLQHKLLNCEMESLIFQRCLLDSNVWSQKQLVSSRHIETLLSDMRQENLEQKKMIEYISEHRNKLHEGIQMVLTSPGINLTCRSDGTEGESHYDNILCKIKEVQNFISNSLDENHVLLLEKLVIITLLQQLGLDLTILKSEKNVLTQDYESGVQQLLAHKSEKHELLQINENLSLAVHTGYLREDKLKTEMDLLGKQLLDLQESHKKSQAQICILMEENRSLTNGVSNLRDEICILEEENSVVFAEAMNLSCLTLIFEQFGAERAMDVRLCSTDLDSLYLREEKLKAQMDLLGKQLLDLQESHKKSLAEIGILIEENRSLTNEVSNLRNEIQMLDEENIGIFAEAMNLSCLSLIFEQFGAGRARDLDSLHRVNNVLQNKVEEMVQKVELIEAENVLLKDSAVKLEDCQGHLLTLHNDLSIARNVHEQLNHQIEQLSQKIETGRCLSTQKDFELAETNKKFEDTKNENMNLHRDLEAIKMEFDELMGLRKELEKRICMLTDDNSHKDDEIANIHEENQMLSTVIQNLRNELADLRTSKEHLASELTYEIKLYEDEVARLWNVTHISTVYVEIFEEKMLELIGECERLEIGAIVQRKILEEQISSNYTYADRLNQKLNHLEREGRILKSKLNAYLPLMLSLQNSIASLENQTLSLITHHELNNHSTQDASFVRLMDVKSFQQLSADLSVTELDGSPGLQKLQARIEKLLEVLMEYCNLLMPESDVNAKSAATEMVIEVPKPERTLGEEEVQLNKNTIIQLEAVVQESSKDVDLQQGDPEILKGGYGQMMKDIQLDQSSYDVGTGVYKKVGTEDIETDDQMLKLWETAESDCNNEMLRASSIATADIDYHQIEEVEKEKSEYPPEPVAEKELGVDQLGMSKNADSHQEWNKWILELLASDAQRLSILQNSMQELKKQLEKSEKSDTSTNMKYETMKGQLKRAEEAILELVDVNTNLTKKAEDCAASFDGKAGEQEEVRNQQKKGVSDHAQRGSEKIGRLELELQKIQYILLKLDEEHENRVKAAQGKSRVILRDYLYGRTDGCRRKRGHFCGCIRPKTSGD